MIFPDIIIRLFNRDPLVIEKAKPYMRIVAVSYLLDAICYAVSFCFRNIGNVKIPMIQGIGSMMFNMLFNYMFIFGKLGSPKLGVTGAALGTLAARIVELIGLLLYFFLSDNPIRKNLFKALKTLNVGLYKEYLKTSLPLCANDML